MKDIYSNMPIGIFDSGVGGISVLKEALLLLPNEEFLYYADSANAPYGTKSRDEILALSIKVADTLYERGIKALLVACNTATSAAITAIRKRYKDIPVIGMEPAVKPAIEQFPGKKILVMATPLTLSEKKFADLTKRFQRVSEIISVPCPGLAEIVETCSDDKAAITVCLKNLLVPDLLHNTNVIVLGCTHYVFVREEIRDIAGMGIEIIDGNYGTVRNLEQILQDRSLLRLDSSSIGNAFDKVELLSSANGKIINTCNKLLRG